MAFRETAYLTSVLGICELRHRFAHFLSPPCILTGRGIEVFTTIEHDDRHFACYCVQGHALRLKPWQSPPCSASDDKSARKLLRKMLEAGASQFHPNPVWALLETTQARREERKAHRRKSKR